MICRARVSRSREEVMYSDEPGATGRGTLNVMVFLSFTTGVLLSENPQSSMSLCRVRKKEPVTGCRYQRPVQV